MDKKKSVVNITVSVSMKLVLLVSGIFLRRAVIHYLGNGINGLNSLFLSIMDVLSLAELGVGEAVTYCMYRPAARGDTAGVSALYYLFRKLYLVIGLVIFAAGLLVLPFLPALAGDGAVGQTELGSSFGLMLLSVCLTYAYGADSALLCAHKSNYITAAVTSGGKLLQYVLQMAVLVTTGSYAGFLLSRVLAALAQWAVTRWIVVRRYPAVISQPARADGETKRTVGRKIRAMFLHKLGAVAVNSTDGILISAFAGVTMLGIYSNYTSVMTAMTGVLGLVFSSLTSVVGHLCVERDRETVREHFEGFHSLNYILGAVFFLGYYAVIDPLVELLFGPDLRLPRSVTMVLTVSYYIQFTRRAALLFRDATGTFYHDRWKPLAESVLNLTVSIWLGRLWGIPGVLLGTVATNLLICHVVEPWVLYRHVFGASPAGCLCRGYGYILLFTAALLTLEGILPEEAGLFCRGCISLPVSGAVCIVIAAGDPRLRAFILRRRENGS